MIKPNSNEGSFLTPEKNPLLVEENVADGLNASRDGAWDHSSRNARCNLVNPIGAEA
jgi:hypothetical protein